MPDNDDPALVRKLEAAVANLPFLQREVFLAHRLEGLSYAEIGWLMGRSERYIERQMAKAIYKLVKQMDGQKLSWWERWF
jgi:RNA polymerase sigma factor (sigma-70 family)